MENQEDRFTLVDMATWSRAEEYRQYTEVWTTITSSINVKISVKKTLEFLKERNLKFAPAMLWAVSREVNRQKNFRYAVQDGQLGNWERLHPIFPTLTADENISFHCVKFKEDFSEFYNDYLREQSQNVNPKSFFANEIPKNNFIISMLPWLEFEGSMQMKNPKGYYAPIFVVGKFNEEKILNVMLTVNHAVVDAWHLKLMFEGLQKTLDNPAEWCK